MFNGLFLKWFRNDDGTTAIEFSLLAIPYFLLTISIIELSIVYASASLLEGAVGSASRLVRTGQIQQSGSDDPESIFRQAICDYATVLIRCEDVVIEVATMNSFSDYDSMAATFDADGNMVSSGFDAGGVSDRILLRASYNYTMMTPFVGPLLSGPDGSMLFMSTIVLQVEPYEFQG